VKSGKTRTEEIHRYLNLIPYISSRDYEIHGYDDYLVDIQETILPKIEKIQKGISLLISIKNKKK